MISTAYYPYPVDKPSAWRAARQPHIYSPPESHNLPSNSMYPHLHASGSPSPTYIYSGYEQYYFKDSWAVTVPSSWPTYYPIPPRSSSLPETVAINPKVTIFPPQPVLVSDIDTPSSISSHSVLTPSSPFAQHDVSQAELEAMDFDEFDCDDEDDFVDSDFADEMEGIDEADQSPSPLYGASAPHIIKSTSALEGALGDTPSSSYGSHLGAFTPADRRLSASVPGYASTSHRPTATAQQRRTEKHSPAPLTTSPAPELTCPSQHTHTHRNYASSLLTPTSPSQYTHMSSSSLAGAFASSIPSLHASRPTARPLPILQPQPIRPIPPIPLADLAASANETEETPRRASPRTLSPLPLLCQPVSDAIRYQFKEPSASRPDEDDDASYDEDNASEAMCEDLVTESENDRFVQQTLAFRPSASGTCVAHEKLYSGCMDLPIRWQ